MFLIQSRHRILLVFLVLLAILLVSSALATEQTYEYSPQWPVESSDRTITCTYDGHGGDASSSAGLDIWSSDNRDIRASMSGKVITVGWDANGYGNYVVIETFVGPIQYTLLYAHMRERSVQEVGYEIDKGQFIGYMGNTGHCIASANGDGTHLHFEVDREGSGIDPQRFLDEGVNEVVSTSSF